MFPIALFLLIAGRVDCRVAGHVWLNPDYWTCSAALAVPRWATTGPGSTSSASTTGRSPATRSGFIEADALRFLGSSQRP